MFDFAVCGGVLCTFAYDRGLFSVPKIGFPADMFFVIFLHFLQKYRCVPKIGFSADISIDIFIDISIDILIDTLIDIFFDISIDIFIGICIDILTDKEEGRGGKE